MHSPSPIRSSHAISLVCALLCLASAGCSSEDDPAFGLRQTGGQSATGGQGGAGGVAAVGGDGGMGGANVGAGGAGGQSCEVEPELCLLPEASCGGGDCDGACRPALDVYILAGQSNMVGLGLASDLPANLAAPQCSVPIKVESGLNTDPALADTWLPLGPGFGAFGAGSRIGPEIGFGHDMRALLAGRSLALIKSSVGATSLACNWNPSTPTEPACANQMLPYLYPGFISSTKTALDELRTLWDVNVAGMLWMQGESDSGPPEFAAAYQSALTFFIQSVRAELETPNLPVVVAKIARQPWAVCGLDPDAVRAAQDAVAAADPLVAVIETDDLPKLNTPPAICQIPAGEDPFHYNAAGLLEMGSRFAEAMGQLQGL